MAKKHSDIVPTRLSMARGLNRKGQNIFVCAKIVQIVVILNILTKIRIYLKT